MTSRATHFALLFISLVPLLVGCASAPSTSRPPGELRHWGAMRAVMREGRTEPRVTLTEVAAPSVYAVGALAGLDGELLIDDGAVWIARGTTEGVAVAPTELEGLEATLLTAMHVTTWIAEPWSAGGDLAALEREIARRLGCGLDQPGPTAAFLLDAEVEELELHVVRGFCPHAAPRPEQAPARYAAPAGSRARLIGFFAPQRAGELTHHGTALHVHALVEEPSGARHLGHVDRARLRPSGTLRL